MKNIYSLANHGTLVLTACIPEYTLITLFVTYFVPLKSFVHPSSSFQRNLPTMLDQTIVFPYRDYSSSFLSLLDQKLNFLQCPKRVNVIWLLTTHLTLTNNSSSIIHDIPGRLTNLVSPKRGPTYSTLKLLHVPFALILFITQLAPVVNQVWAQIPHLPSFHYPK